MNKKSLLAVALASFSFVSLASQTLSLSGEWDFKYVPDKADPAKIAWTKISVPSNWELQGFGQFVYGEKTNNDYGIYRRTFTLPSVDKDESVILRTEGVQFGYTLTIDGTVVGTWRSSYNRKDWDITSVLTTDLKEHVIEIVTSNKPKGWGFDTCDDWTLSGIFRDVEVIIRPKDYITDWKITTEVEGYMAYVTCNYPAELDGVKGKTWKLPVCELWTAETPTLHDFRINGETHKVALREVTWKDGVLKINGRPVKLRGVNHHDLSPEHGRAITDDELEEDVRMIKAANCNFVRLCHYPPRTKMLDLCEKYGLYCMDEVPFAFGAKNLDNEDFFEVLEERARATLARDMNRGCVIMWSVGNENPITPISQRTGDLVASLDPTRPYTFPLIPSRFRDMVTNEVPASVGIIDWHYPSAAELEERVPSFPRPFIASEYAHALGLAFAQMEGVWKVMESHDRIAGGAVWMFQDQGVKRVDQKGEYDTNGQAGTDGIVYSDRTPQTDYYELKAVYAPIELEEKVVSPKPGPRMFKFAVTNRYDFIDLEKCTCKWALMGDDKPLDRGELKLKCAPHEGTTLAIKAALAPRAVKDNGPYPVGPDVPIGPACRYLKIDFFGPDGNLVVTKSYPIDLVLPENPMCIFWPKAADEILDPENFRARVSRRETMNIHATRVTPRPVSREHTIWLPHVLKAKGAGDFTFVPDPLPMPPPRKDGKPQKPPKALGELKGAFKLSRTNCMTRVEYAYTPTLDWETVEAGFTTLLTKDCTQVRFLGDGPYEEYPDASMLDTFGLWKLHKDDLYFPGCRMHARAVVLDDGKGNGYLILPDSPSQPQPSESTFSFSLERTTDGKGIVFSHLAHVSGTFSKYVWPTDVRKIAKGETLKGAFRIQKLTPESWTPAFSALFGAHDEKIVPFKPDFNSYDSGNLPAPATPASNQSGQPKGCPSQVDDGHTEAYQKGRIDIPVKRNDSHAEAYLNRHNSILGKIRRNASHHYDIVFCGDSITHNWNRTPTKKEVFGLDVWTNAFAKLQVLNCGFGGDRVETLHWRLANGELDGYKAGAFCVLIGTNNRQDDAKKIAKGIMALVKRIEEKHPESKIILMPVLPRDDIHPPKVDAAVIARVRGANPYLEKWAAKDKRITLLKLDKFLTNADGSLKSELYIDRLHLNGKGYEIWARELLKLL